ncbi:hypothetical protein J2S02_002655 [Metabacillus niabensis]|uniref:Uncharacterized protein n=1 Tax=Metabacillus niabensis TaxID=324854 RepID=A0ABT9Z4X8_9BACI|nr:hypothetical protein [Metabacillus niabensis]
MDPSFLYRINFYNTDVWISKFSKEECKIAIEKLRVQKYVNDVLCIRLGVTVTSLRAPYKDWIALLNMNSISNNLFNGVLLFIKE